MTEPGTKSGMSEAERLDFIVSMTNLTWPAVAAITGGFNQLTGVGMRATQQLNASFTNTQAAMLAAGGVASIALYDMTQKAMDFNREMALVKGLIGDITNREMAQLSNTARKLAVDFGEAPADIARGFQMIARAGIGNSADQVRVLTNGMRLAKIEGYGLEDAVSNVITATNLFGDSYSNVERYAAAIAHAANISVTSAPKISEALRYVGGAAKEHWTPEETLASIATLAQKGVEGSMAGTAVRSFMIYLLREMPKSKKALNEVGLSFDDFWEKASNGTRVRLKPLQDIIQLMYDAGKAKGYGRGDMMRFLAQFGEPRQMQQYIKLFPTEDEISNGTWLFKNFNDEMQRTYDMQSRLDNVLSSTKEKWNQFSAAVQSLEISVGETGLPALSAVLDMAKGVTVAAANSKIVSGGLAASLTLLAGSAAILAASWAKGAVFHLFEKSANSLRNTLGSLIGTVKTLNQVTKEGSIAKIQKEMSKYESRGKSVSGLFSNDYEDAGSKEFQNELKRNGLTPTAGLANYANEMKLGMYQELIKNNKVVKGMDADEMSRRVAYMQKMGDKSSPIYHEIEQQREAEQLKGRISSRMEKSQTYLDNHSYLERLPRIEEFNNGVHDLIADLKRMGLAPKNNLAMYVRDEDSYDHYVNRLNQAGASKGSKQALENYREAYIKNPNGDLVTAMNSRLYTITGGEQLDRVENGIANREMLINSYQNGIKKQLQTISNVDKKTIEKQRKWLDAEMDKGTAQLIKYINEVSEQDPAIAAAAISRIRSGDMGKLKKETYRGNDGKMHTRVEAAFSPTGFLKSQGVRLSEQREQQMATLSDYLFNVGKTQLELDAAVSKHPSFKYGFKEKLRDKLNVWGTLGDHLPFLNNKVEGTDIASWSVKGVFANVEKKSDKMLKVLDGKFSVIKTFFSKVDSVFGGHFDSWWGSTLKNFNNMFSRFEKNLSMPGSQGFSISNNIGDLTGKMNAFKSRIRTLQAKEDKLTKQGIDSEISKFKLEKLQENDLFWPKIKRTKTLEKLEKTRAGKAKRLEKLYGRRDMINNDLLSHIDSDYESKNPSIRGAFTPGLSGQPYEKAKYFEGRAKGARESLGGLLKEYEDTIYNNILKSNEPKRIHPSNARNLDLDGSGLNRDILNKYATLGNTRNIVGYQKRLDMFKGFEKQYDEGLHGIIHPFGKKLDKDPQDPERWANLRLHRLYQQKEKLESANTLQEISEALFKMKKGEHAGDFTKELAAAQLEKDNILRENYGNIPAPLLEMIKKGKINNPNNPYVKQYQLRATRKDRLADVNKRIKSLKNLQETKTIPEGTHLDDAIAMKNAAISDLEKKITEESLKDFKATVGKDKSEAQKESYTEELYRKIGNKEEFQIAKEHEGHREPSNWSKALNPRLDYFTDKDGKIITDDYGNKQGAFDLIYNRSMYHYKTGKFNKSGVKYGYPGSLSEWIAYNDEQIQYNKDFIKYLDETIDLRKKILTRGENKELSSKLGKTSEELERFKNILETKTIELNKLKLDYKKDQEAYEKAFKKYQEYKKAQEKINEFRSRGTLGIIESSFIRKIGESEKLYDVFGKRLPSNLQKKFGLFGKKMDDMDVLERTLNLPDLSKTEEKILKSISDFDENLGSFFKDASKAVHKMASSINKFQFSNKEVTVFYGGEYHTGMVRGTAQQKWHDFLGKTRGRAGRARDWFGDTVFSSDQNKMMFKNFASLGFLQDIKKNTFGEKGIAKSIPLLGAFSNALGVSVGALSVLGVAAVGLAGVIGTLMLWSAKWNQQMQISEKKMDNYKKSAANLEQREDQLMKRSSQFKKGSKEWNDIQNELKDTRGSLAVVYDRMAGTNRNIYNLRAQNPQYWPMFRENAGPQWYKGGALDSLTSAFSIGRWTSGENLSKLFGANKPTANGWMGGAREQMLAEAYTVEKQRASRLNSLNQSQKSQEAMLEKQKNSGKLSGADYNKQRDKMLKEYGDKRTKLNKQYDRQLAPIVGPSNVESTKRLYLAEEKMKTSELLLANAFSKLIQAIFALIEVMLIPLRLFGLGPDVYSPTAEEGQQPSEQNISQSIDNMAKEMEKSIRKIDEVKNAINNFANGLLYETYKITYTLDFIGSMFDHITHPGRWIGTPGPNPFAENYDTWVKKNKLGLEHRKPYYPEGTTEEKDKKLKEKMKKGEVDPTTGLPVNEISKEDAAKLLKENKNQREKYVYDYDKSLGMAQPGKEGEDANAVGTASTVPGADNGFVKTNTTIGDDGLKPEDNSSMGGGSSGGQGNSDIGSKPSQGIGQIGDTAAQTVDMLNPIPVPIAQPVAGKVSKQISNPNLPDSVGQDDSLPDDVLAEQAMAQQGSVPSTQQQQGPVVPNVTAAMYYNTNGRFAKTRGDFKGVEDHPFKPLEDAMQQTANYITGIFDGLWKALTPKTPEEKTLEDRMKETKGEKKDDKGFWGTARDIIASPITAIAGLVWAILSWNPFKGSKEGVVADPNEDLPHKVWNKITGVTHFAPTDKKLPGQESMQDQTHVRFQSPLRITKGFSGNVAGKQEIILPQLDPNKFAKDAQDSGLRMAHKLLTFPHVAGKLESRMNKGNNIINVSGAGAKTVTEDMEKSNIEGSAMDLLTKGVSSNSNFGSIERTLQEILLVLKGHGSSQKGKEEEVKKSTLPKKSKKKTPESWVDSQIEKMFGKEDRGEGNGSKKEKLDDDTFAQMLGNQRVTNEFLEKLLTEQKNANKGKIEKTKDAVKNAPETLKKKAQGGKELINKGAGKAEEGFDKTNSFLRGENTAEQDRKKIDDVKAKTKKTFEDKKKKVDDAKSKAKKKVKDTAGDINKESQKHGGAFGWASDAYNDKMYGPEGTDGVRRGGWSETINQYDKEFRSKSDFYAKSSDAFKKRQQSYRNFRNRKSQVTRPQLDSKDTNKHWDRAKRIMRNPILQDVMGAYAGQAIGGYIGDYFGNEGLGQLIGGVGGTLLSYYSDDILDYGSNLWNRYKAKKNRSSNQKAQARDNAWKKKLPGEKNKKTKGPKDTEMKYNKKTGAWEQKYPKAPFGNPEDYFRKNPFETKGKKDSWKNAGKGTVIDMEMGPTGSYGMKGAPKPKKGQKALPGSAGKKTSRSTRSRKKGGNFFTKDRGGARNKDINEKLRNKNPKQAKPNFNETSFGHWDTGSYSNWGNMSGSFSDILSGTTTGSIGGIDPFDMASDLHDMTRNTSKKSSKKNLPAKRPKGKVAKRPKKMRKPKLRRGRAGMALSVAQMGMDFLPLPDWAGDVVDKAGGYMDRIESGGVPDRMPGRKGLPKLGDKMPKLGNVGGALSKGLGRIGPAVSKGIGPAMKVLSKAIGPAIRIGSKALMALGPVGWVASGALTLGSMVLPKLLEGQKFQSGILKAGHEITKRAFDSPGMKGIGMAMKMTPLGMLGGLNKGNKGRFQSPLKIYKGYAGDFPDKGQIVFPQLDPDLFKQKAVETGQAMAGKNGSGVQIIIQPGAFTITEGDPEKIKQIVYNAIVEAGQELNSQ